MSEEALNKMIEGTKEERKYLASLSFGLFALYYFQSYFKYPLAPYHYDFIQDIQDLADGKIKEVLWVGFRESAKTTIAQLGVLWLITFKKKVYLNLDAYSATNSERSMFDIAFHLLNNKRLKADFGVLYTRERSLNEMKQNKVGDFTTENGIRLEANTTQVDVRGRKHFEQRPDFRWVDDFETNDTKTSKVVTADIKENLESAMSGMEGSGVRLYTANYLTEHGNVQWIIDRSKRDPNIRVRIIPIIIDGKPAWPSKYCLTDAEAKETGKFSIESKSREVGSYVFSYDFMCQPVDDSQSEFKKDFIQHVEMEIVRNKETTCYVTIDPAISEKASADYTGITINFISRDNKWYLKCYKMKFNSKDLIDHLFYLHKTYKPDFIGMEEVAFTMAIQPFLDDEMRKQQIFFSVTPLKHRGIAKAERIRGVIPRWDSRSIFLIGDNSELLDEMRTFPHGQHDDVLDSLSYQIHNARPPHRPNYPLMEAFPGKEDLNPAI